MSEERLLGGDLNVVVRVGDTVRRPVGLWSDAVHSLLRHFEAVGFDGAPRFLGIDEQGREILSYVEGEAALDLPRDDEAAAGVGALLRRMHAAQREFERPPDASWFSDGLDGPLVCHGDLFPPNVILRQGVPAALVDWDLAGPGDHLIDVAGAAYNWAPLRADGPDDLAPTDRARRARAVCDGYGLDAGDRARLVDRVLEMREHGYALHHRLGAVERRPGWREMWDAGSGAKIRANAAWVREHRRELEAALQ